MEGGGLGLCFRVDCANVYGCVIVLVVEGPDFVVL